MSMGLSIFVGLKADLIREKSGGIDRLERELAAANLALSEAGIEAHREPSDCEVWSADGYGYKGLHALSEVAGLVFANRPIPRDVVLDGDQNQYSQPLFELAADVVTGEAEDQNKSGLPPFMHLAVHPDSAGFYLPIDFPIPLIPNVIENETAQIWPVGSTQALQRELTTLSNSLEIPNDLRSQDDRLWELLDGEGSPLGSPLWQRQPIASYSLLILREACDESLRTGAAIAYV